MATLAELEDRMNRLEQQVASVLSASQVSVLTSLIGSYQTEISTLINQTLSRIEILEALLQSLTARVKTLEDA